MNPDMEKLRVGVLQVHSDLQMLARAVQENDPKAEIAIRISDVLAVMQDRLAPALQALAQLSPSCGEGGEEPTENLIGAAELAVGQFVYRRIEKLMDAEAGTPDARELSYLADLVGNVEEYGARGDEDAAPSVPTPVSRALAEEVARIIDPAAREHDYIDGEQTWSTPEWDRATAKARAIIPIVLKAFQGIGA